MPCRQGERKRGDDDGVRPGRTNGRARDPGHHESQERFPQINNAPVLLCNGLPKERCVYFPMFELPDAFLFYVIVLVGNDHPRLQILATETHFGMQPPTRSIVSENFNHMIVNEGPGLI